MSSEQTPECICSWYVEPHGELMAEPEPDCPLHFPAGEEWEDGGWICEHTHPELWAEGRALVQAIHDRKAANGARTT